MKKIIFTTILFCAVFFTPQMMRADSAAQLGKQIGAAGTGFASSVSGNTVTVTGSHTGVTAKLSLNIDAGVTVKWGATISSTANITTLISLLGSGTFEVAGGAIAATNCNAISAENSDVTIIVSSGTVSCSTKPFLAIYTNGISSKVTISGGMVSTTTSTAVKNEGANSLVTVSGTGQVQATGNGGIAIYTMGNVHVIGGIVSATTGNAIYSGTGSTILVDGGMVFAYGNQIIGVNNVIYPSCLLGNSGGVVAWYQAAGHTTYTKGSSDDLIKSPASASVTWDKQGSMSGIYFSNGSFAGFMPVGGVTVQTPVNAETPTISVQPKGATVSVGAAVTLSVTASVSDGGALSYQWYHTSSLLLDGTAIIGATASSYSPPTSTAGTYYYYVVVKNTNNNATVNKTATAKSNTVTVTVPVCSIGTTTYTSLDDALAAVPTGGTTPTTIKLLANIDYSSYLTVSNKKITFDLNGKNLNANVGLHVEMKGNIFLSGIGNFNVTNTYINASGDKATVTNVIGGGAFARQGGELTVLGNVTATSASGVGAQSGQIGTYGGTIITIDGTITVPSTGTYIIVGTTTKTKNDYEAVTTKEGYLTYTDGSNTVWVKSAGTAPTITTTNLLLETVGTACSLTLNATGDKPITWTVSAGSLPAGLSLAATTGTISGTPTASGTFNFTVKAANATGSGTKALTMTIVAATAYTISASTLTSFGSLPIPYTQPAAQTVTVTNTGTGSVTLNQPTATNYIIGTLSTTALAAGAKATFTVQPKANLAAGNYNETISISGTGSASEKSAVSAKVDVSFTVTGGTAIETVSQATGLKAWVQNGTLHVTGLTAGKTWRVYTVTGVLVTSPSPSKGGEEVTISLPGHGLYIVQSGNWTVKVMN